MTKVPGPTRARVSSAPADPLPADFDRDAFARDIETIRREFVGPATAEDVAHIRRIDRGVRVAQIVGFATAWIAPNPLSILLLGGARFVRWTVLSHHILHGAFDSANAPRYHRKRWASGWRRWLEWPDWMPPDAWHQEHNALHHYRLGEAQDPDLVEDVVWWLRTARVPLALRYVGAGLIASLWKPLYYAPKTIRSLYERSIPKKDRTEDRIDAWRDWWPAGPVSRAWWTRSLLPYSLLQFLLVPLLFLPISAWAAGSVLLNSLAAEWVSNAYGFFIVAPSHAADDLWRFDGPSKDKTEFLLRQICGSANYRCGTPTADLSHGWLNYQIEHHLFPSATPLQYRRMQPHVRALCERHGVPYRQEPALRRFQKLLHIMVGRRSMSRLPNPGHLRAALAP